jgi:heme/copper-type cytochrome/quinol oxidase subunit 3
MAELAHSSHKVRIYQEKNRLGMLLFVASEASFFSILISAYIYYQGPLVPGPNASNSLHLPLTAIYTVCLLSSSLTMVMAGRSVERDDQRGTVVWLLATILLGGIFLFGQVREYIGLLTENIAPSTNLFGTTFFTLTGFHGLHVFGGLVALAILTVLALAGDFKGARATPVEVVSIYWHFVDIVWVFIFSVVYLWPLFV